MNVSSKIINSPLLQHPWEHKIIDDFFDEFTFSQLSQVSSKLLKDYGSSDIHQGVFPITRLLTEFNEDLTQKIMSINLDLLSNVNDILKSFPEYREYQGYFSIPTFTILNSDLGDFPIHDDKVTKSLSIVVYIHPEDSSGTKMYSSDYEDSFHHSIDWKPNRALIFCGISNKTWHTFGTGNRPRITLNFSLQHNIFESIEDIDNTTAKIKILPGVEKIMTKDKNVENFYNLGLISTDKINHK